MTCDYVNVEGLSMSNHPSSGEHLITAGVARLLGCSEANVRSLERQGVLIPAHVALGGVYPMSIYHRYRGACSACSRCGTVIEDYMADLDFQADTIRAAGMRVPKWLSRWGSGRGDGPIQRLLTWGRS